MESSNNRCSKLFKTKEGLSLHAFESFQKWYTSQQRHCHYCGLTEAECQILYYGYPLSTRGGKRGKNLEIDRKNPVLLYSGALENFVFSCYWCNNAKSNHFTSEEFMIIAPSIAAANMEKIRKLNLNNNA